MLARFFSSKLSAGFKPAESLERLISHQFGTWFNSYTQAVNKAYGRQGSLFTPRFKRKEIDTEIYLRQVIVYVHLNPVLHQFRNNFEEYPYSSYTSILNKNSQLVCVKEVIELFEDRENFIYVHEQRRFKEDLLQEIIKEDGL